MTERLFSFRNPNKDIMEVEQQEGGVEDDNYFGSIGDAYQQHIQTLNGFERQMWEDLIHMPSGSLFTLYPSPDFMDDDPLKMKGANLKDYISRYKDEFQKNMGRAPTESELVCVHECLAEEETRRDSGYDLFDNGELIPYHEWEQNPNMWQHVDIPSTPRDRPKYMGNCSQNFYDSFPEGHPNANVINACLTILNREFPLDIDESYANFVCAWLDQQKIEEYVRDHLKHLTMQLYEGLKDPDNLVEETLQAIDRHWGVDCINEAAARALKSSMTKLILYKEKEWEQMEKEGIAVYSSIKSFGFLLFSEFKDKMNSWHWSRYQAAKKRHAPRVILQGLDLNRCTLSDLRKLFREQSRGSSDDAHKLWLARPFETLEEAYAKKLLKPRCFSSDKNTEALIGFVEKHAQVAKEKMEVRHMTELSRVLIKLQQENKGNLSGEQWNTVWRYYKILKQDILNAKEANEQLKENYFETREENEEIPG